MDLDLFAAQRGVAIVEGQPEGGAWGTYCADSHTITLLSGLGPTQRRTTLAHELGHAVHRHRGHSIEQEKTADAYATWLLFGACHFFKAAQGAEHIEAVAADLGVMPDLACVALKRARNVLRPRRQRFRGY